MNPITKHRLIQDIFFSLQTSNSMDEMVNIFRGYDIKGAIHKDYNQIKIKKLLEGATDSSLLLMAKDLKIDTSSYVNTKESKTGSKKQANYLKKVFISHSSKDKEIVTSFIQIIQAIGILPKNIFCTSLEGYGASLGVNFMEEIETRLNEDVLVFFMLSENFYKSPMCLIEMGATWIKTKNQISVAISPFRLEKMQGVFKHFLGMKIDNEDHYDLLKEALESKFEIESKRPLVWNPQKRIFVNIIKQQLNN